LLYFRITYLQEKVARKYTLFTYDLKKTRATSEGENVRIGPSNTEEKAAGLSVSRG